MSETGQSVQDRKWMRAALELARHGEGRTRPNPPVGAVVVRGGRRVGAGYHQQAGGPHAEIHALNDAGAKAPGATLYVTLEPCCTTGRTGACTEAILAAGIRRVVVAVRDPNPVHAGKGLRILRDAGLTVTEDVCADTAARLILPFAKWVTTGLPYVTLKMGMSLDGKIADRQGRSRWITGVEARDVVQDLRRRADAVLVGSRTACVDDPSLLSRADVSGEAWRVVVDSRGRLSATAKVLTDGHADRTIVATTRACPVAMQEAYLELGAQVWLCRTAGGHVSLADLMRRMGRAGLLHVLCEGGGELASGLTRKGLIDRFLFFVAPLIVGGRDAPPVVAGQGWLLREAPHLRFEGAERIGRDVLLTAVPDRG